jgi:hypothetical protein
MKSRTVAIGLCLFTAFTSYLSAQSQSGPRIWTDQTGRKVNAQLIEVQGSSVVILLENKTQATVPLARFSAADQAFVQQWVKSGPPPTAAASSVMKWPPSVEVDPKSLDITNGEQNEAARSFVYRSGYFQFTSNAPLTGTIMREIAGDFELVRQLFFKLPWGWKSKPEGGGQFFLANLYETDKDFIAAGGDDQSSGWSKDGLIFTKFSSLGLKKVGARYARDTNLDREGEMIALITRLVMGEMRDLTLPWSALGLESFLEDAAYRNGSFQLDKRERGLKKLITERTSPDVTLNVNQMIELLHQRWSENRGNEVLDIRRRNYLHGAMLIYYFGYLEGKGDGARLHSYFEAVAHDATLWRNYSEARKAGDNSARNPRPNTKFEDWALDISNKHIIGERSDAQFREDMIAKFKAIGIKL